MKSAIKFCPILTGGNTSTKESNAENRGNFVIVACKSPVAEVGDGLHWFQENQKKFKKCAVMRDQNV